MKREAALTQKSRGKFVPPSDPLFATRPRLAEAVADLFWDDGSAREPWGLSVNWSSGTCLVQLNDKEIGRSLSTSALTLIEALDLLEALLSSPCLPWRSWGKSGKPRR